MRLNRHGYGFADATKLVKKIFGITVLTFALWNVMYMEFRYVSGEGVFLPWSIIWIVMFVWMLVPFCSLLPGREDYEVTRLRETLQIHRFCIFLGAYKELGREATVRWLMKIADRYHVLFECVLLSLETGREAPWEKLANRENEHAKTRILGAMWTRILLYIKDMDVRGDSLEDGLLKSRFEYADKVCYEEFERLEQKRIFICKIIAYLPVFGTMIFYMIYPFVLEGIKLINTYSEEMQAMGLN